MSPRKKLAIVATTAAVAVVIVAVTLASIRPMTKPESVNELPVPLFTYQVLLLTVTVNASLSFDPDGSIENYTWDFGDDFGAWGVTAMHEYAESGTYQITLTVTDDQGGQNSTSQSVAVTAPAVPERAKPVPVIEVVSNEEGLVVLDGSGSWDPDGGSIVSYEWDFGDDATDAGVTAEHQYSANGTYTVTLTVTNDGDETNSTSIDVVVTISVPPEEPPDDEEPPEEPPRKHGPPGLYIAIEKLENMADKNKGVANALEQLKENLSRWLATHGAPGA